MSKNPFPFHRWMAFGVFDLFHEWHKFYLSEAKKQCQHLRVVVARDARVLTVKGRMPCDDEDTRREGVWVFSALHTDMEAVLGDSDDILAPIVEFAPDILFFGYDQHIPEELLRQKFPYLTWKRIGAYHPEIFKSSLLRKKALTDMWVPQAD